MNIVNIENLCKIYGEKVIFDHASFGIQQGDKIGIVGINGTGKTTLLRMISGEEVPDEGQIIWQNGLKIAHVVQDPPYDPEETVEAYALDHNPDTDWRVQSYLNQLKITDMGQKMGELSGGQRRRVAMARTLAREFDLLLLDEPTNHLDEEMIGWLEEFLSSFRGTLLMVTHDRYFLDKVTNRILEISHGQFYGYQAAYSGFLQMKAEREERELATERKRQSILRIEQEWAKRGCRARTTKQKARLQRLEELKQSAGPRTDETVELDYGETRMGKKTIEFSGVSKSYGDRVILKDLDYIFLKHQNVGIVGANGCGKSTFLKMIAGEAEPDLGQIDIGETIRIGYFAQEEQCLDDRQRVIDYVKDIAEYITTREGRISASAMLERFLFTPDMQYAPIGKLSGGEKRRLYLLGVLCREVNVLLLDEPGNNLDIPTLTILEDFLSSFVGIVITVSHDRYFLDNVADRILAFDGQGGVLVYEGGYTDYLEAAGNHGISREQAQQKTDAERKEEARRAWKQGRTQKLKFTYQEQKEFETIEEEVAGLENKIEEFARDMARNATNSVKLSEIMAAKEEAESALEEKMERWVYLNDLYERIQKGE